MDAQVIVRQGVIEDKDFILSTWLRGQFWGSNYWKQMPQDLYFKEYAKKIIPIIANSYIEVAVLQEDPSFIIGFLVHYGPMAYWAYIKKDYRSKGILNLLLKDKGLVAYSGDTKAAAAIAKKKQMIFNPLY